MKCFLLPFLISLSSALAQNADVLTYEADDAPLKGELVRPTAWPESLVRAFPDLPQNFKETLSVQTAGFSFHPGLALLLDYSEFSQDAAGRQQLGIQDSGLEMRRSRVVMRGHVGESYQVNYLWALDYSGREEFDDSLWRIVDLALSFPLGGSDRTFLAVGKMKEPFSYELVSGFGNLPHQERILNPFFEARNIGGQVTHVTEDQLWTVRAGVFNDSRFETGGFDSNDWRVATRLTHLVWDEPERGRYLHWGLAGRYVGAAAGTLRYGGRPASNVTLNFVDTGEFPAEHAWHVGVEWLWNEGPFSVLAEANQAWVTSSAMGDPFFWGAYVTFAWVLTGESRSYDRTVGYARRINPKGKWGAPELVVRLAHLDLDDARASGGVLDRLSIGLNWWATRRWKVGVDCGRTRLNRDSLTSTTEAVMARMQWIF